jgi:hypothetical protein
MNEVTFSIAGLLKTDINYGLVIYVAFGNDVKTFSDAIVMNHAPVIKAEDQLFRIGELVNITFDAYDLDGDELNIGYSGVQSLSWIAEEHDLGSINVTINASDSYLSVSRKIEIYIIEENYPPILSETKDIVINETEVASVILYAEDIDGDNITYNVTDDSFIRIEGDWFEWQTDYGDAGNYTLKYFADDGKEKTYGSFSLRVLKKNSPPMIVGYNPKSDQILNLSQSYHFWVNVSDEDALIYTWYVDGVAQEDIDNDLIFMPSAEGIYEVKVSITDRHYIVEKRWTVMVTDSEMIITFSDGSTEAILAFDEENVQSFMISVPSEAIIEDARVVIE